MGGLVSSARTTCRLDGGCLDEGKEDLEVVELAFSEALEMVETGKIVDAKTIMLLQWAVLRAAR